MKYSLLVICSILLVLGCEVEEPICHDQTSYLDYNVKYQVTGTAQTVNVTIVNTDVDKSQFKGIPTPWTYTFSSSYDTWVYCSAQNLGTSGSVTVTIYVDDVQFEQSTRTGAYGSATASGSIDGDAYRDIEEICR